MWVKVSDLVVMPNHIHGIIWIGNIEWGAARVGAITNCSYYEQKQRRNNKLSKIIKWFKQVCTKAIRWEWFIWFQWHRSYYDCIIKVEKHWYGVKKYIANNPTQWE